MREIIHAKYIVTVPIKMEVQHDIVKRPGWGAFAVEIIQRQLVDNSFHIKMATVRHDLLCFHAKPGGIIPEELKIKLVDAEIETITTPAERLKEVAQALDGCESGEEKTRFDEAALKKEGIVVITSEDPEFFTPLKLYGAMSTEIHCEENAAWTLWNGGFVDGEGMKAINDRIEDYSSNVPSIEWKTAIYTEFIDSESEAQEILPVCSPNEPFKVMENGEPLCIGSVFYLKDLEEAANG